MDSGNGNGKVEPIRHNLTATKLPAGDFDIRLDGLTPVEIIGLGEIIKGMGMGMIQAAQVGGLVRPGVGDTRNFGGRKS